MKKILENNKKTKEYLNNLSKIYLVGCWAKYGVMEFPFAGKYIKENGKDIPLVYNYNDCNGACDQYWLEKITNTTTGWILCWTQYEAAARAIVEAMNHYKDTTNIIL